MSAAGCADAAAVERAADQLIQVSAILHVVAQAEVVVRVDLVIHFRDAVVVVFGLQDDSGSRRAMAQSCLRRH